MVMSSNDGANQAAAEIVNTVMRKLVGDAVEGKKVYDLVVEGDQAIEAAAATVYNKKTKTGAVPKGLCRVPSHCPIGLLTNSTVRHCVPNLHICQ
jgi:hypothetical protein